ncbi:unnamed protein product [Phytomonas sp. EM1]|nr:unnamed protein product [Phytomonas sp. EM1]|eukprot:CCW60528.1 unnamed protein product [Phytomonas sp. isolate EM1]
MTNQHPRDSSQTQLTGNLLEHSQSQTPRASSPLLQRIDRIQYGIKATLDGIGKDWLNVQPCVLQGFNNLVELVQNHEKRLCKVDDEIDKMRQTVQILINDRLLKEERYQLDCAVQSEAVTALEKLTQRLRLTLEGERKSRRELQHEVQRLQRDIQKLEKECHLQLSNDSKTLSRAQVTETLNEQPEHSSQELHENLMREIHLLRMQWENYRLERQESPPEHFNKQGVFPRVSDNNCCVSLGQYRKLPFPPQSARWFWMGDGSSHFSTALSHSDGAAGKSISPPIPWEEVRLYDPVTTCWYFTRSCLHQDTEFTSQNGLGRAFPANSALHPYADAHANGTRRTNLYRSLCDEQGTKREIIGGTPVGTEAMDQWNCFDWVRPRSIRIKRSGIYKYTTCLLRDTNSSSPFSGGVGTAGESLNNELLVLYVNHRCVANLEANNSCVLLHANTTANTSSTGARRSTLPGRRQARSLSTQRRLSSERFTRQCCEPDQLATSTLSNYIFLPEGAIVQVRCHNMHNTKTIYEAFLELEYIV